MTRPIPGNTLGERIERAIRQAGITKQAVADHCGVRWHSVQNWCKDIHPPRSEHLMRIAEITGVSVEALFGALEGHEPDFPAFQDLKQTQEWKDADEYERRAVRAFLWPPNSRPSLTDFLMVLRAAKREKK